MGEDPRRAAAEADAIRAGLDLGFALVDTAEMYGEGGAERVVGAAIKGRRETPFLVSKVYPHNAGRRDAVAACERSLKRLGVGRIDLYLLHWRGSVPLAETLEAFHALCAAGKIGDFGVSNFDVADMAEWARADRGLTGTDQVLFNLARRGPEFDLLPWLRARGVPLMAYSPFDTGPLLRRPALAAVARRLGATPGQVALAWLLAQDGVVAIPKSADPARLAENWAAQDLVLGPADLAELDRAFPPPKRKAALEMI